LEINTNRASRFHELEHEATRNDLVYPAKCWVYKRGHSEGQNGDPSLKRGNKGVEDVAEIPGSLLNGIDRRAANIPEPRRNARP
jgi:hypothetical protein